MDLKKIKTIGIFGTFGLCFLTHFIYNWFPNFFSSIFFPVNESIWEHMKMLVSSILIWEIIEFVILNKLKIKYNNFIFAVFMMCLLSLFVFLIIYLPIYDIANESFILNIVCLFITIYFVSIIGYFIMIQSHIKCGFVIGFAGIILFYCVFAFFTYCPPKNFLFLDPLRNGYGILDTFK